MTLTSGKNLKKKKKKRKRNKKRRQETKNALKLVFWRNDSQKRLQRLQANRNQAARSARRARRAKPKPGVRGVGEAHDELRLISMTSEPKPSGEECPKGTTSKTKTGRARSGRSPRRATADIDDELHR